MTFHGRSTSFLYMVFEVDADGKRPYARPFPRAPPVTVLGIYFAMIDAFEEIGAVIAQVKPEEVVAEQSVQQLFLPGESSECLAIGPRYMPELGDGKVRIPLFQKSC